MADPQALQAKLKVLSDAYAAQLPAKLEQIELSWHAIPLVGWDEEGFQALHRMVHSLTGSGKTFGFPALSDAARNLEACLKLHAQARSALSAAQRDQVQGLLVKLRQAALTQGGGDASSVAVPSVQSNTAGCRRVYIVEDDEAQAEELKVQLSYFGYEITVFNNLSAFRLAMQANPDVVVLMDIQFPEGSMAGIAAIREIQQSREKTVPVIFISAQDEFTVRLEAVRVGGIAYIVKPVHLGSLIDRLDEMTSSAPGAAYRVLIIEDSVALASLYAGVLEQAGMEARAVNDPLTVMPALSEFVPDLILVDMYMPGCDGMELAKVIRQMDVYDSIPIVFLSAERDVGKQQIAMNLGGDDFLSKPIQPERLVAAVTSRIRRSLRLRALMVRDGLTGLLNHAAITDQFEREVARAIRQGMPLSLAMVDIDHFKRVNDTYGHPAGDRVIKSLARLLKQRLRGTDLVGRYGGEEFAIVLVDTDAASASKVLDAVREDFSRLHHQSDAGEFGVTFSCGIAEVGRFDNAVLLSGAADKALYQAKHAGRNRTCIADAPG
ncbi:MAG: diguanylate cyclase [Nitrosomonadales bacterium]|nr:diguanylate cyclase [Nitrosomonadales bacterium]